MMDEEITLEIRQELIRQRIAIWRNTVFQATADFRVAQRVGDAEMITVAKATIARAEKFLMAYGEELAALQDGEIHA